MCLFLGLLLLGPRAAIVFWWLFEPARWALAFDSFLLPFFGFLFLPWTTLMYVLVAPGGLTGLDLLWVGLAAFADIATVAGGAVGGRGRVGSYY